MFTQNQELSFYEKSLQKTESLLKGGRAKTYIYHEAFPNLRFYPRANDALQNIQAIINLATTDMPTNPLTASIKEALQLHGKLHVELVEDSTFNAYWVKDKKTIRISNIGSFTPASVIDSFIVELCNATNRKLLRITYDSFHNSEEYAQCTEEAEVDSNNRAASILGNLGVPSPRKPFEVKEAVELSHSVLAVKTSNGFSHFDRYVNHHNEFWIRKIKLQLIFVKFQLISSYLPSICLKKVGNYYASLKDKQQRLNIALGEKYALRDALNKKAEKNLADAPYTSQELLESLYEQQRETLKQLEELQQLQQIRELKQREELEQRERQQYETLQQLNDARQQLQQLTESHGRTTLNFDNKLPAETAMLLNYNTPEQELAAQDTQQSPGLGDRTLIRRNINKNNTDGRLNGGKMCIP
jgi:hypothetical protein